MSLYLYLLIFEIIKVTQKVIKFLFLKIKEKKIYLVGIRQIQNKIKTYVKWVLVTINYETFKRDSIFFKNFFYETKSLITLLISVKIQT